MLRTTLMLIASVFLACSGDKPAPTASSAGKANCMLCAVLGTDMEQHEGDSSDQTETPPDTTAAVQPEEEEEGQEEEQIEEPKLFEIEFLFADNVPERDRELFRKAAKEWEEVILQGLPDTELPRTFGEVSPVVHQGRPIDDLLVVVHRPPSTPSNAPVFGFQAFAQVHHMREDGTPALGQVTYTDDARTIIAQRYQDRLGDFNAMNEANDWNLEYMSQDQYEDQTIETMAVHEIGHLLGMGTTEAWFDLVKPSSYFDPPQHPKVFTSSERYHSFFFTGEYALRGFGQIQAAFANFYGNDAHLFLWEFQGTGIPMDEEKHHWAGLSETHLDVMSGWVVGQRNGIAKPYISALSLGALADLGYDVDRVTAVYRQGWDWGDWITIGPPAAAKPTASPPLFVCRVGQ